MPASASDLARNEADAPEPPPRASGYPQVSSVAARNSVFQMNQFGVATPVADFSP